MIFEIGRRPLLIQNFLLGTFILCCWGFQIPRRPIRGNQGKDYIPRRISLALSVQVENTGNIDYEYRMKDDVSLKKFLIHWRGEKDAGYSKPFRQLEFENALAAELSLGLIPTNIGRIIHYTNALNYAGNESMAEVNIKHFNEAMQFVSFSVDTSVSPGLSKETVIRAAQRCSLIHGIYEIIATSEIIDDLAELAIRNGGFSDLYKGGSNEKATWCFRARMYSASASENSSSKGRGKRYSSRARSLKLEKDGLEALKELLVRFGGEVNLEHPDCKIYILDGLEDEIDGVRVAQKFLARRIASGPKTFLIAPAERICITNTPLEPIAAFALCNIARIKRKDKILDPYAGSCTTLLAAAMIAPDCESVGIEIAHNGLVNREDIVRDFTSRNLKLPNKLILGDSTDASVRDIAKTAVQNEPFDCIIADPPYGIRESVNYNEHSPLEELFTSVAVDRNDPSRERLLKVGGRLVAFVPVTDEQVLEEMLPSQHMTEKAGLAFEVSREQPLNEKLSRYLVCYVCIK